MSSTLISSATTTKQSNDFKVMGYFCETPFTESIDESLDFTNLTHVIYAFLKPKEDGTLYELKKPELLKELVEKAHKNDVKVIVSIGGIKVDDVRLEYRLRDISNSDIYMNNFLNSLKDFMTTYDIDGIEVDWEYPRTQTKEAYESFIIRVSDFMHLHDKSFSAAVAGAGAVDTKAETVEAISDQALEAMDFLNIMVYDLPGKDHSPFWFADCSLQYYLNRGVPREKLILGIPLYGLPSWKQYRHLVDANKDNAYKDFLVGEPLNSSYNGLYTIGEKTRLSLIKGGGVMFFEIHEDTHDETSALKMVREVRNYNQEYSTQPLVFVNKQIVDGTVLSFKDGTLQVPLEQGASYIDANVYYSKDGNHVCIEYNEQYKVFNISDCYEGDDIIIGLRQFYETLGYTVTYRKQSNTIVVK